MGDRPAPPPSTREGFHWVAVAAPDWRVESGGRCRYGGGPGRGFCGKGSAASLCRGTSKPQWWAYCPDHLYGRWVENGEVMQWVPQQVEGGESR